VGFGLANLSLPPTNQQPEITLRVNDYGWKCARLKSPKDVKQLLGASLGTSPM